MSRLDAALSALCSRRGEMLPLLERLVGINSYSSNIQGVNAVGVELMKSLADLDLTLERASGQETGDHFVFSTKRAAEEPAVLLIGHHDTVFPPGTFEGMRTEGEIVYGPGVLDMKGALSMIAVTLHALCDADALGDLALRFVTVGDEEIGSPSSRPLLEGLAKAARLGLVFEAGRAGDVIITERRGSGNAIVTAQGRAAHAGNALAEGRNAIWALSRFVDLAQRLTDEARGISVNVGIIRGGTSRNTVPERASAELDLRFSDFEGRDQLIAALHEAARQAEREILDTTIDVRVHVSRGPLVRSEESVALCTRYSACQTAAGLFGGESPRVGGGSDANTVGAVGLPVIDGLGPRGSGFHTHQERMEVPSLYAKAEALVRFLLAP